MSTQGAGKGCSCDRGGPWIRRINLDLFCYSTAQSSLSLAHMLHQRRKFEVATKFVQKSKEQPESPTCMQDRHFYK